jgi:hypothetical protein
MDQNMISFDAFLVLQCIASDASNWRAKAASRGVLDIDEKLHELLAAGAVDKTGTSFALTKLIADKLLTQINQIKQINQINQINQIKQITQSKKLIPKNYLNLSTYTDSSNTTAKSEYGDKLSTLINHSAKMSNPAYRAVVDNVAPSRKARGAQLYAQQLSAADRPNFWKEFGRMNATQQAKLNHHFARLVNRGRRN